MDRSITGIAATVVVILFAAQCLNAQNSLNLFNIDASRFPRVTGSFYLLSSKGAALNADKSDFALTENGTPRTILSVSCPEPSPPQNISSVLVLDVSWSMGGQRLDLAKTAALAWVNEMPLGSSECAVTSFSGWSNLNQDFTTKKDLLVTAINRLVPNGGTNYQFGFMQEVSGAIPVALRGRHKRVILFLTDGMSETDADIQGIKDAAIAGDVTIHCISIGMPTPVVLGEIAGATGGRVFGNVNSTEEAVAIYSKILHESLNISPCTIEWQSASECLAERNIALSAKPYHASATASYVAPGTVRSIKPDSYQIEFGEVAPNTTSDLPLTLTAGSAGVTVTGITIDNPLFSVVSGGDLPITIPANGTRQLGIRFSPTSTARSYGVIHIESDACSATDIYLAGGSLQTDPGHSATLELLLPNGGERFGVGSDTVVTWTNVLPETPVRLDYSTDAGVSWQKIADSAKGLRYVWTVPGTPSERCLARVSGYPHQLESVVIPHVSAVLDVAVSPDARLVATVRAPGDIALWDPETGQLVRELGRHPYARRIAFNRNGNELYSLADGENRLSVWNLSINPPSLQYSSGGLEPITAFAVSGPCVVLGYAGGAITTNGCRDQPPNVYNISGIRSLQYNANGTRLVAGTAEGNALVWYASTGTMLHTLQGHAGPVISADFSIDDQYIVTADFHNVRVWKDLDGSLMRSFAIDSVVSVRFSPDGTSIIVVAANEARILDVVTGATLAVLSGHGGLVSAGEIANNNLFAVTASLDSTARIWKMENLAVESDRSDSIWAIAMPKLAGLDLDFGPVEVGRSKDSLVQGYLHNTGSFPVRVDSIRFVGGDSVDFSEVVPFSSLLLLPDSTTAVEVRFRPGDVGIRSTTAEIVTGAGTLRQSVRGEGLAPTLQIVARYIDFGPVDVGDRKDTTLDVIVRNIGLVPVNITATPQTGPDMTQFVIVGGAGPFTLLPGEGHGMALRFAPSRSGRTSGGISFESDRSGVSAVTYLYGEGIDAGPAVPIIDAPATSSLELRGCGDDLLDTLILVNTGRAPLRIDSARLSGPDADHFSLVASVDGASIEPRDTLRLVLRFSSSTPGQRSAQLLLANNDPNDSLHLVELIGRRQLPGFRLSVDTIDLGLLCPDETRDTTVALINIGEIPLDVRGSSESLFAVEGTLRHLDTAMQTEVPIRFMGSRTEGEIVGEIVFVDTVCGSVRRLVVRGEVSVPVLVVDPLDLVSNGGRMAEGDVVVRNVSNRDVRIEGVRIDGSGLRLVGSLPVVVSAGGEAGLHVVYEGSAKDTTEYKVDLIGSPCEVGVVGFVRVVVRRGWTRVEVGSGSGRPGDRVRIPLRVTESAGLTETDGGGYEAEIRFDRSVLLPVGGTPMGRVEGGDRVIRVKGEGSWSEGELGELEFIVGLGGVERTDLELVEFRWSDTTIGVEGVDGGFEVLGVCGEPVSRLYRAEAGVGLKSVRPNPGGGVMEIEYEVLEGGETEMYVVDLLGQRVKEIVKGEMSSGRYISRVEVGELGSGQYVCILRTGGTQSSLPIVVRR